MNINGKHYCSRCLAPIPDEIVCPFCGHDPEASFDSSLMEEGTLLSDQRYRVGVIIKENHLFCYYGGWDYYYNKPVIIKELFPKHMVSRNIFVSDNAIVSPELKLQYDKMLNYFLCSVNDMFILHPAIHTFLCNGFGYHILDHSCLSALL